MPPVPKPRSQSQSLSQAPSIPQVSDDFDSIEKTNISLIEESQSVSQSVSQSSSVKISSEAQVERSESSSLKSKHDIIHDDDSITDRLENESFPHSERIDLDPYEAKLDSLEYDTTERSTSSIYKVKERENILDDDDDGTDYEGKASAAFYIGESSGNIITKSSTEKRSELEHDNDGSEAKESTQFDEQPKQIEQKKDNIESDEGHSSKRDSQHEVRFKLEPEEIGVAAYGKDDDFVSKLERVPTGLDKSLEEKCDTELPEKIIHESPIPSDYKQDEEALGSELSFSSGGIVESHVEITELSSASESIVEKSKLPSDEEPVVKFPSETIIEDDHHVKIEQLDSFDMTPATEPHRAAVIHSPVEAKSVIEEFEYSIPLDTNVYKQEISEHIESQTTDILQPTTVTETTLIQPSAESFEYDTLVESKTAPVVHSPIQAKEFTVKSEFDDYAIETQQSTAPVKHSPVQSSFEIYASETSVKTEQLPKEKLIDDFSFDFDKPKVAAVVHSPIESSKSDVKEEFKETVGAKSEPIDDFSFDFDKPKFAPVGYSPVESAKQDQQIKEESFEHFETQAAKPKQTIEDTVFSSKTEIIDDYSLEFDKPKTAPVEHSPIETSKSDVKDEFKETVGAKSEPIDDFSFDLEKPKPTPVLHSPVESVKQEQQIETVSVEHFDIRTEEPKQPIEETAISGKAKLIDDNSWEFDKPKMAPVLHSPIESTKLEQPLKEQITETLSTKSEVDDFSFDFDKPKSAPVVHSPVENVKQEQQLEKVTFEHFEVRTDEPKQPIEDTTFSGKADIIDDYSWEFGKPKAAPVLHSPIETSKPDVKEELKESVASKFEQIDDFSFDFDKPKSAPVLHSPIETSKQELSEKFETRVDDLSQKQADESSLSTGSKSEVVHRMGGSKVGPKNRWSTTDPDHSSPSSHNESLENSRPCSSDVENLYLSYPNSSAEYQTALDASSLVPGSTEYHTAVSTFDHSGKTISSQESMKSLDSESSGNLGSVEVSEASETLVPSELDFDETEQRLSSLDTFGDNILEESILDYEPADIASNMKRSHEMIFAQKAGTVQSLESLSSVEKSELSERKGSDEEFKTQSEVGSDDTKFGTSLTDGSVLSMSFSTTSNDPDTIVENIQDDMASSYGAGSLVGSYETKMMLHDESTSFDEKMPLEPIDNLIMTTSTVTEDNVTSVNTQITSDAQSGEEATPRRGRHKRNDSTSFIAGLDMAKLSQESTDSSSLDEEMVIHDVPEDDRKESGSDSDYDRYETEYSRSFKKPGVQRKKKSMSPKSAQKPEPEQLERKKSIPSIETIVEVSEDIAETEKLRSRGTSQNMLDYSQIPDITITDDPTKYVSDDEDFEQQKQEPEPEIVAVEQVEAKPESPPKSARVPKPKEPKISHEEYEKLIERQYKTKENEFEEPKADSPTSDSFELVEQPDISDEFVIIEEVAKEAHELMTEGKSVSIQQTKYMKKHDDDVEKIIIKSAPAATNEGSTLLQGRHDLAFEFEESPSSGANTESSEEGGNGLESSRKWVEMQLAEQAQNLRYPYEVDRGMLEDIKEEDTDFEIGSSRISSFKDSYSSNDFEAAAARRYQSKEHDNISVNSLQEFERLEQAISLENRKFHSSSNDSFSNGSFPKRGLRTAQADEISLSSLQDFEGLENACLEHTLLELKAKEEHALLLSRSDDSNKSDGATKVTEKMIVTKAEPPKTSVDSTGQFTTTQTVMTKIITETRSKALELDDDFSSSNLMEVSTDSLEAKHQKQSMHGKNTSQHGSSDSLEISKSADVMTSSIDSIEISKDCATGKSSKSDCDSIEQIARGDKRDSIDSIDAQYAAMTQSIHIQRDSFDANLLDLTSSGIMGGSCITDTKTITTTSVASSSGYGGGISKDISSDSLNLNQEPELLITSTESLDHTSSTFATYQSQTDSQMTMSGSMTSCDSNTLVDSYETQYQTGTAANLLPDDKFGARMTSTTVTTTTAYKTKSSSSDVDKS